MVLNLMSLQRRRERFIIIMMWKLLHRLAPNDMGIRFNYHERRGSTAELPSFPRGCRMSVVTRYDSSFAYMGPRLWNVLPRDINQIDELDKFKRRLTKWLLSLPDKPPVHGYVRANNNSLVEVVAFSNS